MSSNRPDCLATLAALGLASDAEVEELLLLTMDKARTVAQMAVKKEELRVADVEDVVMKAAERAWQRIQKWNSRRGGWLTYVSQISRSEVGNQRRQYAKDGIWESIEDHHEL